MSLLGINPNLTHGPGDFHAQAAVTHRGQAHFAGTGPAGETCGKMHAARPQGQVQGIPAPDAEGRASRPRRRGSVQVLRAEQQAHGRGRFRVGPMKARRLTTNAVIGRLCDNDRAVIIQASTRAMGLTYCISDTFELVDTGAAEKLIAKGVLVEAGDAKGAHCIVGKSFALADNWRGA